MSRVTDPSTKHSVCASSGAATVPSSSGRACPSFGIPAVSMALPSFSSASSISKADVVVVAVGVGDAEVLPLSFFCVFSPVSSCVAEGSSSSAPRAPGIAPVSPSWIPPLSSSSDESTSSEVLIASLTELASTDKPVLCLSSPTNVSMNILSLNFDWNFRDSAGLECLSVK